MPQVRRRWCPPPVVRWAVPPAAPGEGFLGEGERERVRAGRSGDDADRFVRRRWYVRSVVAEVAGCSPDEVRLHQRCASCGGPHGPPTVEVPRARPLHASWGSAGELVVVAVCAAPVGVDVERAGAPVGWARLEAVLKATGHGLDVVDAAAVVVSRGRVRRWPGPGPRPRLRVEDLAVPAGHVGAVAWPWGR